MKIPSRPPTSSQLFQKQLAPEHRDKLHKLLTAGIKPSVDGRYCHWDKLKYLDAPEGLSKEDWWFCIKLAREKLWNEIPLRDRKGTTFKYGMPDAAQEFVHNITQNASGAITISEQVIHADTRERYVVSSLIEEAVTSSQLEGAATTTPVAKEMIRSGRKPRDKSERMIFNNYAAIREIREFADQPLSSELVLHIHQMMTVGTLDDPATEGRLRRDSEYRVVKSSEDQILHEPPPASELEDRLARMCDFANDRETFVHPVARAVLLHFWLAYDHPFIDGNGRTARALFYWSMLSQGYWLTEYLSISSILKSAPAKYARSFLYTEHDENDATYFLLHQLNVINRAIKEVHIYLRRKATEISDTESLLRNHANLNHRQLAVLSHGLHHSGFEYTFRSHQNSHNIVYETARNDLVDLAKKNLLEQRKRGRTHVFTAPSDLPKRLRDFE